ncbi:unnamed protein product [Lepeophtheirus salmonis]|uniref:(salmon louse) hypothetical protein n=1 Tax=Lepeophtheirus salmonis TaxID=72036 RepID=A0A7R8D5Z7_LEPSM|nr:unnamed protein product [Lepeophtheirus salmonis]CAF2984666.1 unnamed protein product [Lepeophtheirus salmonis]
MTSYIRYLEITKPLLTFEEIQDDGILKHQIGKILNALKMVLGELSSDKNILSDEYKVISRVPGTRLWSEKNRILSHPKLLKSLPDGGEKIKIRIRSLKELIDQKKKKDEEEATKLMSELTISKVDVDALEWNSGISAPTFEDFDDEGLESKNPFKILTERELENTSNKSLEINNRMNYRDKKEEHDSDDSLNESDDEFATPEGQSEDES